MRSCVKNSVSDKRMEMNYLENDPKELEFLAALELLSPGTELREGIDYIITGDIGGLIVIGDGEDVMDFVDGGFHINCEFLPTRLYELAKMDGAIILSSDLKKIVPTSLSALLLLG